MPYYIILGDREKYKLFNLKTLVDIIFRLHKFFKFAIEKKTAFCFVTFRKEFCQIAKSIALQLGQDYIIGSWVNGFVSRHMLVGVKKHLHISAALTKKSSYSMHLGQRAVIVYLNENYSKNFLSEISIFNLPTIFLFGSHNVSNFFTFVIPCEPNAYDIMFFYLRVISFFISYQKTK